MTAPPPASGIVTEDKRSAPSPGLRVGQIVTVARIEKAVVETYLVTVQLGRAHPIDYGRAAPSARKFGPAVHGCLCHKSWYHLSLLRFCSWIRPEWCGGRRGPQLGG
jgi:hypothetical protein